MATNMEASSSGAQYWLFGLVPIFFILLFVWYRRQTRLLERLFPAMLERRMERNPGSFDLKRFVMHRNWDRIAPIVASHIASMIKLEYTPKTVYYNLEKMGLKESSNWPYEEKQMYNRISRHLKEYHLHPEGNGYYDIRKWQHKFQEDYEAALFNLSSLTVLKLPMRVERTIDIQTNVAQLA